MLKIEVTLYGVYVTQEAMKGKR